MSIKFKDTKKPTVPTGSPKEAMVRAFKGSPAPATGTDVKFKDSNKGK